jgi:CRP-like cAMP-binding protein
MGKGKGLASMLQRS